MENEGGLLYIPDLPTWHILTALVIYWITFQSRIAQANTECIWTWQYTSADVYLKLFVLYIAC